LKLEESIPSEKIKDLPDIELTPKDSRKFRENEKFLYETEIQKIIKKENKILYSNIFLKKNFNL